MGAFDSKPLSTTPLNNTLRRKPLLFGVPFVMIMVVASYALVPFAQTKYELQDRRVSKVCFKPVFYPQKMSNFTRNFQVSKEQELGLENRKRKFDIREEYFASVSFHIPSPRFLRLTSCPFLETQREGCRRLGAQTYRTSSRYTRMGRTTARTLAEAVMILSELRSGYQEYNAVSK